MDIDAQLYALQALVRIHPALGTDLYFQHTSEDAYSIFSPFYASVINLIDLRRATLLLTILFISWFLVATWMLARELCVPKCRLVECRRSDNHTGRLRRLWNI